MTEGGEEKAAPDPAPAAPVARGAALRRELLAKLPALELARGPAGAMDVDPSALDLGADEFIEPLHTIVERGQGK